MGSLLEQIDCLFKVVIVVLRLVDNLDTRLELRSLCLAAEGIKERVDILVFQFDSMARERTALLGRLRQMREPSCVEMGRQPHD